MPLKNKKVIAMLFLLVSFFIIPYFFPLKTSLLEVFSSYLVYPCLRIQQIIISPIARLFSNRATIAELSRNLHYVKKENEQLRAENISLQALLVYSEDIQELYSFKKRYNNKGIISQVLARHFSSTNHFFFVDAGSSRGIQEDMVAIYGNTIVGKITQVYPWYCKVTLITDKDCKVAATIVAPLSSKKLQKKQTYGIHEGKNSLEETVVNYVSHLDTIEESSLVLSSGEGLIFPKGFALGTINSAKKDDLFYTISVKPLIDFENIQYCMLISKENLE